MVKAMDCGIVVRKFVLQSRYYVHLMACPCGVTVKAMDCGIVIREFEHQSRYYLQFRTNTHGKGMNYLILLFSREGVAPSPTSWCSSYRKGSLRVTLDYGRQLYFYLYIYIYIYTFFYY